VFLQSNCRKNTFLTSKVGFFDIVLVFFSFSFGAVINLIALFLLKSLVVLKSFISLLKLKIINMETIIGITGVVLITFTVIYKIIKSLKN
jgi:hypothetical protein